MFCFPLFAVYYGFNCGLLLCLAATSWRASFQVSVHNKVHELHMLIFQTLAIYLTYTCGIDEVWSRQTIIIQTEVEMRKVC